LRALAGGDGPPAGPGTALLEHGDYWIKSVVEPFWDDVSDDPGHPYHQLQLSYSGFQTRFPDTYKAAYQAYCARLGVEDLQSADARRRVPTSLSMPDKLEQINVKGPRGFWLLAFQENWDFPAKACIAHGIDVVRQLGRMPSREEFTSDPAKVVHRLAVLSTVPRKFSMAPSGDPVGSTLKDWEKAPHGPDPFTGYRGPMLDLVSGEPPKELANGSWARAANCGGALGLSLPTASGRQAVADMFTALGFEPSKDGRFSSATAMLALVYRTAGDTIYSHWPVTSAGKPLGIA
jgi:hypothetical protein